MSVPRTPRISRDQRWTIAIRHGWRRTIDLQTLGPLAALFAVIIVVAVAVLVALSATSGTGALTEAQLEGLRPAVDAAVSERMGAPATAPLVLSTPEQFTLHYAVKAGALTFTGRSITAKCDANVLVNRAASTPARLSWALTELHPCRAAAGSRHGVPRPQGRPVAVVGPFSTGQAALDPATASRVRGIAGTLGGARSVACVGFADDQGTPEYNVALGYSRATMVCKALAAFGVRASMVALSLGESHPRAGNSTASGRAENRRVEVFARR